MFCTKCGRSLGDGQAFCPNCGTKNPFAAPPAEPSPAPEPAPEPAPGQTPPPAQPAAAPDMNERAPDDDKTVSYEGDAYPLPPEEPPVYTPKAEEPAKNEPYEPEPQPEPQPAAAAYDPHDDTPEQPPKYIPREAPKAQRSVKKRGAGACVLSVFLSILLFFTLLCAFLVTTVRTALDKDDLTAWIDSQQIGSIRLISASTGKQVPLAEFVKDELSTSVYSLSTSEAKKLLNKPIVKEGVTEAVLKYRAIFLDGSSSPGVTPESIADFILDNRTAIQNAIKSTGLLPEQVNVSFDRKTLEADLEKHIGDSLTVRKMLGGSVLPSILSFLLSSLFMILCWAGSAVLFLLLILVNRRDLRPVLLHVTVPMLFIGLVYIGLMIGAAIAVPIINLETVADFYTTLCYPPIMTGAAVCCGSFLFSLVVYIVWGAIRSSRKKKEAR